MKSHLIMKLTLVLSQVFFSVAVHAQARQSTVGPAPTKGLDGNISTATSTSKFEAPAVKKTAQAAQDSQNMGTMLGVAATAMATTMAVVTCSKPGNPQCPYWVAGAAMAGVATLAMSGASKTSGAAVADVTSNIGDPGSGKTGSKGIDLKNNPKYQQAMRDIDKLKSMGIKVDLKKGKFTMPDGSTFAASDFNSPQSMAAKGFSGAQIADFGKVMEKINKAAKGVDGSSTDTSVIESTGDYSGGDGGGGGRSATAGSGGIGFGIAGAGQGSIGVNRDPAQVEGSSVMYNGEQIGVAVDSIYKIQNRRYKFIYTNESWNY
jgi:hypothetical protein